MDEEGLDLDALEAELAQGRAGLVPLHDPDLPESRPAGRSAPSAGAGSPSSRPSTISPILEDDPYGRVRYEGEPLPSIHELEGGERVTFTSSFSKTVAPGLRIGYFVVPQALVASYDDRAVSTYISPSLLPQATVFELISRGAFEPNLDRVRGLLKAPQGRDARRARCGDAGRDALEPPEGGYFLWLDFAGRGRRGGAARRGRPRPGSRSCGARTSSRTPPAGRSSARLAFSYESPERIAEGVALLASLLP